jgi:hypothetical protein
LSTEILLQRARWAATAALVATLSGGIDAADVRFEPRVDLGYYADGNVAVVGTDRVSDEVLRAGLRLRWVTETPGSSFSAEYAPYQEWYREFSDLDNLSHVVSVGYQASPSRRSNVAVDLYGSRSDRPPVRVTAPGEATTLLPRTEQDRFQLDVTGRGGFGSRTFVDWGVRGERVQFRDDPGGQFEDSDTTTVRGGLGLELAEGSALGGALEARWFDLETQEGADTQSLFAFWNHDLDRSSRLTVEAGVERTNAGPGSTTSPRFDVRYAKTFANQTTLEAGARQDVAASSGAGGPTTDRGVYGTWRQGDRAGRLDGNVTVFFWNRQDVFDDGVFHVKTLETAEALSWYPGRSDFAIGAFHSYYDQIDIAGANPGLETNYHRAGVFVRWEYGRSRGARS